jgi:RimJ/RimL family protein N-acetyltransferase
LSTTIATVYRVGDLTDNVPWPTDPIATDRLELRATQAADRAPFIDLLTSPIAREYLGGPLDRAQLERDAPTIPASYPGAFAVADASGFVRFVRFDRRDPDQPGHIRSNGRELEVSYMLLPDVWGRGYGSEAVAAALDWAGSSLSNDDVILCTQVANECSRRLAKRLGFVEAARFIAYEAEQWLGARPLPGRS